MWLGAIAGKHKRAISGFPGTSSEYWQQALQDKGVQDKCIAIYNGAAVTYTPAGYVVLMEEEDEFYVSDVLHNSSPVFPPGKRRGVDSSELSLKWATSQ